MQGRPFQLTLPKWNHGGFVLYSSQPIIWTARLSEKKINVKKVQEGIDIQLKSLIKISKSKYGNLTSTIITSS